MRFAIILAAASATLVVAQDYTKCKDASALGDCATPYSSAISDCSTSDISCLCKAAAGALDCFDKYCPEVTFPYQSTIDSECGTGSSSSSSSSGSSSSSSSSDSKSGGGDTGAGASLFAPAGGVLAAIVAVAAML